MDDMRDELDEELGEETLLAGDDSLLNDEDTELDDDENEDPLLNGFSPVEEEDPTF